MYRRLFLVLTYTFSLLIVAKSKSGAISLKVCQYIPRITYDKSQTLIHQILNKAGESIDFYWVNEHENDALVKLTTNPVEPLSEVSFNSFYNHKFVIRFHNHIPGVELSLIKSATPEAITIVTNEDKTKLSIQTDVRFSSFDNKLDYASSLCKNEPKGESYINCITDVLSDDFKHVNGVTTRLKSFRDLVSFHLRNYTCADTTMISSKPISTYQYTTSVQGGADKTHDIKVLLDYSHAKIWTVDNFITPNECSILMEHGRPKLTRATVAADDGTSIVSEHRKAQQASYDLNPGETDPLWPLYQRILQLTNHHTGYDLRYEGQESFTIIQYNIADQYTPHCDSDCDGSKHQKGGRIATAVLYCKIADEGGATTFTKSDLYVKPQNGSVTFFSYQGPDERMDPESLTEHSGCPVTIGEKWIATFWMRGGVEANDPWNNFDPSGLRIN